MPVSSAQPDGTIAKRRAVPTLILTVSRPAHANAYTQAMLAELHHHIEEADADPAIRAIVVTGEGDRSFCAGARAEKKSVSMAKGTTAILSRGMPARA